MRHLKLSHFRETLIGAGISLLLSHICIAAPATCRTVLLRDLVDQYLTACRHLAALSSTSSDVDITAAKAEFRALLANDVYFNGAAGTIDPVKGEYIVELPAFPREPQQIPGNLSAADIVTNFVGDFVIGTVRQYRVLRVDVGSLRGRNRVIVTYDIQAKQNPDNWLPVAEHITFGKKEDGCPAIKQIDVVTDLTAKVFP